MQPNSFKDVHFYRIEVSRQGGWDRYGPYARKNPVVSVASPIEVPDEELAAVLIEKLVQDNEVAERVRDKRLLDPKRFGGDTLTDMVAVYAFGNRPARRPCFSAVRTHQDAPVADASLSISYRPGLFESILAVAPFFAQWEDMWREDRLSIIDTALSVDGVKGYERSFEQRLAKAVEKARRECDARINQLAELISAAQPDKVDGLMAEQELLKSNQSDESVYATARATMRDNTDLVEQLMLNFSKHDLERIRAFFIGQPRFSTVALAKAVQFTDVYVPEAPRSYGVSQQNPPSRDIERI